MTQNHQSALKCANLVNTGITLLQEIKPSSNIALQHAHQLGATLEELKRELQNVLNRAERKQQRRVLREKMKTELSSHGGAAA